MGGIVKKRIKEVDKELLRLGNQNENAVSSFLINIDEWLSECPNGFISALIMTPSGAIKVTKASLYGSSILWEITSSDTSEAGIGKVQFTLKDSNGIVVKSKLARYIVSPSIDSSCPVDPFVPADSALKLATPREISLSGNVQGSAYFDGSKDIKIPTVISTLSNEELEEMLK